MMRFRLCPQCKRARGQSIHCTSIEIGRANFHLTRLREPDPEHDLARILVSDIDPKTGEQRDGFESADAIQREVKFRARSFVRQGSEHALKLADALLRSTAAQALQSLSHPPYVSELRRRLVGEIVRIVPNCSRADLRFYTIALGKWKHHADALPSLRPKKIMQALRALLIRVGFINEREGWSIAAFHSEYDPATDSYQPHVHVVVYGEKHRAFEALRELKMFKGGKGKAVYRPILCNEIIDVPRQVSYLFKGYWPAKPSSQSPVSEGRCRARCPSRIPEPRHAESLLFLDQQRFSDLVWLHGLVIKDGRLVPTKG